MRILIAPQAYKGTLSAQEAAQAIQKGVLKVFPHASTVLLPVADGGDGTLDILLPLHAGERIQNTVTGPFEEMLEAPWGIWPESKTALLELAQICGVSKVPLAKLNPAIASTYGVGEIMRHALDRGCRRFILGIGGSCTNDAGAGLAQALGAHLLDKEGRELPKGGVALKNLAKIDLSELDPRLAQSEILVACDVDNPLLGPHGASFVYGPQKGATPEIVQGLEAALTRFAHVVSTDLGMDLAQMPFTGAAGGAAAGLKALLNAELLPGSQLILRELNFEQHAAEADLVITGEGRMDRQTLSQKAPLAVAQLAKKYKKPVIAIVGSLGEGYEALHDHGIDAIVSLSFTDPQEGHAAFERVVKITEEAMRCYRLAKT